MVQTYVAKILICSDCGEEFVFTADAQEYLAGHGFNHDPKRCKSCHIRSKRGNRSNQNLNGIDEETSLKHIETDNNQKNLGLSHD